MELQSVTFPQNTKLQELSKNQTCGKWGRKNVEVKPLLTSHLTPALSFPTPFWYHLFSRAPFSASPVHSSPCPSPGTGT